MDIKKNKISNKTNLPAQKHVVLSFQIAWNTIGQKNLFGQDPISKKTKKKC